MKTKIFKKITVKNEFKTQDPQSTGQISI
jgi:hypothetical protein